MQISTVVDLFRQLRGNAKKRATNLRPRLMRDGSFTEVEVAEIETALHVGTR